MEIKTPLQITLEKTDWKEIYDEDYGDLNLNVEPKIYSKLDAPKKRYVFDGKTYDSLGDIEVETGLPSILIKEWFKQHKYKKLQNVVSKNQVKKNS